MKKLNVFLLAMMMTVIFTAPSFAMLRKDIDTVKGMVTYINPARTEITVKESATGKDVTFSSPSVAAEVMNGSPVIVLYKKGTTTAKTIRVIKKGGSAPAATAMHAAPKVTTNDYTVPKTTTKKSAW